MQMRISSSPTAGRPIARNRTTAARSRRSLSRSNNMALHFEPEEFAARRDRLMIVMAEQKLDAVLLFAQESMYWLTGYDTFGFCFFQCLVVKADGSNVLMTRSADLRQARQTS